MVAVVAAIAVMPAGGAVMAGVAHALALAVTTVITPPMHRRPHPAMMITAVHRRCRAVIAGPMAVPAMARGGARQRSEREDRGRGGAAQNGFGPHERDS